MGDPRDKPEPIVPTHDPWDIDIEQALLGSVIRDPALVPQAMAHVDADHFYDPLHARIWDQVVEWTQTGDHVISALTLMAAMKSDPGIVEVSGAYFEALRNAAPGIPNVVDYARMIRELALRRDALAALDEARAAITLAPTNVSTALRPIMGVIDAAERLAVASTFRTTYESAMDSLRAAQKASAGHPVRAVKTGLVRLDAEIGGIQGADFVVVAGKSGMGKSALMGGISWRAAAAGYPIIVFSLEMKRAAWVQRLVTDIDFDGADAAMEYRKYRTGGFTDGEFSRAVLASQMLQDWPWLEIHDDDGLTMAQITARARAFQAKWKNDPGIRAAQGTQENEDPIGLVIIDYLQIVDPASRQFRPREQEVRDIARGGKALAKNLDWGVMAGSQVNEDDKGRAKDGKRPQAGDVRESKAIYHEADIMIAPYRPAVQVWAEKPEGAVPGDTAHIAWKGSYAAVKHKLDLLGLKNRMGATFDLDLYCDMASSSVRDERISRRAQAAADDLLKDLKG